MKVANVAVVNNIGNLVSSEAVVAVKEAVAAAVAVAGIGEAPQSRWWWRQPLQ
jgi:hypothetical protein